MSQAREFPRGLRLVIVWPVIGTAVFLGVQAMQSQARRSRFSFDSAGGAIPRALAERLGLQSDGVLRSQRGNP